MQKFLILAALLAASCSHAPTRPDGDDVALASAPMRTSAQEPAQATVQRATQPQTPVASYAGLSELIVEAHRAHPGLAAKQAAWMAAKSRIEQVQGYPDPSVGVGGFLSPLETRNGPVVARIGVKQRLPWPQELDAKEDGATARAAVVWTQWQSMNLQVQEQLQIAWWELAFLHQATELVKQTLQLVITSEDSLHAQLEVGRSSLPEVIRIEIERAKLEDRLANYQDQMIPLRFEIRSLIGTAGDEALWPKPLLDLNQEPIHADDLPSTPPAEHPELLEFDYSLLAARAQLDLAQTNAWPEVMLGLEWTVIGDGPASAPDSGQDALAASIQFSLPLHQNRYEAARREAKERMNQFTLARRDRLLSLSSKLSKAQYQYRDAHRRIALYRDQLGSKTERGFDAALSALETGNASFESLLDTLRLLLEFQVASARAEADSRQALARIERLAGFSYSPQVTPVAPIAPSTPITPSVAEESLEENK